MRHTARMALLGAILLISIGCGSHLYHRVEAGDTLYSISWQHGFNYRDVARWNALAPPYTIYKGQIIRFAPASPSRNSSQSWTLLSKPATASSYPSPTQTPSPSRPASSSAKPGKRSVASINEPTAKHSPRKQAVQKPSVGEQQVLLKWEWPAEGQVRPRSSVQHAVKTRGVEIAGRIGQPVRAAASGKVVYSGNGLKGYGNLIIIKHSDDFLSAYANNHDLAVKEGQQVRVGQKIAAMGRGLQNQVALYFEIRRDGKPVDPLRYLPSRP